MVLLVKIFDPHAEEPQNKGSLNKRKEDTQAPVEKSDGGEIGQLGNHFPCNHHEQEKKEHHSNDGPQSGPLG